MDNITDMQPTIYNKILGEETKGFADNIENIEGDTLGYVLKGMEYRPDLLAEYYLGSSSYGWAIILANHFEKGIEDLTLGRKFIIPNIS